MTGKRMEKARLRARLTVGIVLLAAWAVMTFAYTHETDNVGRPVSMTWQGNSITWNLNPAIGTNVSSSGGPTAAVTIAAAFNAWTSSTLNGQSLVNLSATQGPDSSGTSPNIKDCINTVSFKDTSSDFPTGVIAFTEVATVFGSGGSPLTYTCVNPSTGASVNKSCNPPACLVDADIQFSPSVNFVTSTRVPSGSYDLRAIATHEAGHFLGMDHSGIAHSIMFPYGDAGLIQQRTLAIDDVVGLAASYPNSNFDSATGTISGTITQAGTGIFGAHVVAMDSSGATVIDGLTNPDGTYKLAGTPPGTYTIVVAPLSGVYNIGNFGGWSCGFGSSLNNCAQIPANPTDYTATFY